VDTWTISHTVVVPQVIPRQRLFVPAELYSQFRPIVIARGHENSRLVWRWLCNAVVDAGHGRDLPSRLTVSRLTPREIRSGGEIRWSQHTEEWRRWGARLYAANSSPDAVIQAEIRGYIASGGDVAHVELAELVYV
jgi:hypothetical protein